MPNAKELQSIVDYEVFSPAVDPVFHQAATCTGCTDVTLASCSCTASVGQFGYWSSTTVAYDWPSAWYVDFFSTSNGFVDKSNDTYVRAVRGGL